MVEGICLALAVALITLVTIPVVVYFSVKLGAYAFVRGRRLAQRDLEREDGTERSEEA